MFVEAQPSFITQKIHRTFPITSCWPEYSHNCKESWEKSSSTLEFNKIIFWSSVSSEEERMDSREIPRLCHIHQSLEIADGVVVIQVSVKLRLCLNICSTHIMLLYYKMSKDRWNLQGISTEGPRGGEKV